MYKSDGNGNNKLDHVQQMLALRGAMPKQLPFATVLMDSWYAAQKLMAAIEELGKVYYCFWKTNRIVDDSGGSRTNVLTNSV